MSEPRISVIIPTVGRDTLQRAVESAKDAYEVLTIDGAGDCDHGYAARERGIRQATGTHLAFLDDDDIYLPGAIATMREHATDRPVIFRMSHPTHGILWRDPALRFGNVGTPMFLVPNQPDKLGRWRAHDERLAEPGGDFTFISGCVEKMGDPEWRSDVVAKIRPGRAVSVVTPWLDHLELFPNYAASVRGADEVIIVDDGSRPELDFAHIRFEQNVGYTRATNAGLGEATGEVVVLLNNDVVMRRPDWLRRLTDAVEPGVLAGPRLRYDLHGAIDGQRLPYLDGWCLAGMRDDLAALGGLDESLMEPAYYSDNDLCLRARAEGMRLREVKAGIEHIRSATTGPEDDPRKQAATAHNRALFAERARALLTPEKAVA